MIPYMTSSEITIYSPSDIELVISRYMSEASTIKTNKDIEFYNVPCAFDIETTSFYSEGEKQAIMYEWTLGLNGGIIVGRTWDEFIFTYNKIVEKLGTHEEKRLIIYVHNLAFEFQFIRKRLEWDSVFAGESRKPIYARTVDGIELRCSYLLSGYSLAMVGSQLRKYPVQKAVGDLDYSLYRHSKTPLTDKEIGYCVDDVRVVMNYIRERIETDSDITKIPLTKTGYVRVYCRNACFYEGRSHKKNGWKYVEYSRLMNGLRLEVDEYQQLKRAFQGGFTHANAFYSGQELRDVASFDFTSSYPAVMVSEMFPMSSAQAVEITSEEQLRDCLMKYCCIFDLELHGLEATVLYEHPLSASRCSKVVRGVEDNGRIVCADSLVTTLTEQDFFILERFYKWDYIKVTNFRQYKKGYLPTDFVRAILKLYSDKTTLKGVEGKEEEYLRSKEMVNSCYGMIVTDICRDSVVYIDDEWFEDSGDVEAALQQYNNSKKRFLFYPWGVWVTAYARRNLFTGICEFQHDYIYSDTDSVKVLNASNHLEYIERYNEGIIKKLQKAMKYHGLPIDLIAPKTIEGKKKPLGVWDYEGTYTRFKTLGAKRYMTEKNGRISITVSGVNKHTAVPYLLETYGDRVFSAFEEGLYIPATNATGKELLTADGKSVNNPCGKNTHTYIDDEQRGVIRDYLGNTAEYHELSSVHLEAADYSLSLSDAYVDYLLGIREYNK